MKNLKREKLYKQVFYTLKNYILDENLQPGDKLQTENELIEMLGVSRNVLREALKTLELMGMVESKAGVGIIVQDTNLDFFFENVFFHIVSGQKHLIEEVLDIRKRLELSYAREAFRALTHKEVDEIERMINNDLSVPFELMDQQFHLTIYKNLNNKTLNSLLQAAWYIDRDVHKAESEMVHEEILASHKEILDALKAMDEEAFMMALNRHFHTGLYGD